MKAKIKSLPKADQAMSNVVIPNEKNNGNIGRYLEKVVEAQGYPLNTGKGLDIPELNVEMKSRDINATSAVTIGRMKIDDILVNTWETSIIREKSQYQYKVFYDKKLSKGVTSSNIVDYTQPHIQEKLKKSYESARKIIIDTLVKNDGLPRYIRGDDCWGYFENTDIKRPNWYDFRLSDSNSKKLDAMSKSTFTKHFDYE